MNKTILLGLAALLVLTGASCSKTTSQSNANAHQNNVNSLPPTNSKTTGSFSTGSTTPAELVNFTASGVDRPTVTIAVGTPIEFRNGDSVNHHIASNPHPTHTDLPGFERDIPPGGTYTFTFTRPGTFGYHDHLDPSNVQWQGKVIVQ